MIDNIKLKNKNNKDPKTEPLYKILLNCFLLYKERIIKVTTKINTIKTNLLSDKYISIEKNVLKSNVSI